MYNKGKKDEKKQGKFKSNYLSSSINLGGKCMKWLVCIWTFYETFYCMCLNFLLYFTIFSSFFIFSLSFTLVFLFSFYLFFSIFFYFFLYSGEVFENVYFIILYIISSYLISLHFVLFFFFLAFYYSSILIHWCTKYIDYEILGKNTIVNRQNSLYKRKIKAVL